MTRSLILKALPIVIAVVLLQLAFAPESQAQGGYGDGYGGGYGGGGYGGGGYGGGYGGGSYGGGGYGGGGYGGGGYGGAFYYTVQYGDTLFAICRKFGVDPYQIAQVNGLPNPDHIYAGQVLYIPSSGGYCPRCQYNQPRPQPSHWQQGCGGQNCSYPSQGQGCGNNCYQQSHWQGCGNNCDQQGSGYDYTGYYYDYNSGNQKGYSPNYQRYSYTCGYNYNCY